MKFEIKKYQKLLEMQRQKQEYEELKGFSGENRLFHKAEEAEYFSEFEED